MNNLPPELYRAVLMDCVEINLGYDYGECSNWSIDDLESALKFWHKTHKSSTSNKQKVLGIVKTMSEAGAKNLLRIL